MVEVVGLQAELSPPSPTSNPSGGAFWVQRMAVSGVKQRVAFSSKFMLEVSQLAHSFMSSWGQVCKDNIGKYDIIVDTFTTTHHGLTLAEASGIPACTIHYVPVGATSYYYSPYAPYGLRKTASGENYLNLLSHEIIDYFYGLLARRPMNKTRIELGLKPITGFSDWDLKLQTPRIYCHRCGVALSLLCSPTTPGGVGRGGNPPCQEAVERFNSFGIDLRPSLPCTQKGILFHTLHFLHTHGRFPNFLRYGLLFFCTF